MGLIHKCPYYKSDKKRTISCENRLHWFPSLEKKKSFVKAFCCDRWEACSYARALSAAYETGGEYDAMLAGCNKEIKALVQQIGILEKKISQMDEVAKKNHETYDDGRRRLESRHVADIRSIEALENCVAYVLHKHGENMIELADYKRFVDSHDIEYDFDAEGGVSTYRVTQKGEGDGDKGSAEAVQASGGDEVLSPAQDEK